MGTMKTKKRTVQKTNKSVFLFHKNDAKGTKLNDAREIGKTMAQEVAKKLKLNLNI